MSVDTIVLAADGDADDLANRLAATAADIADPSRTEIVLAHVFDEDECKTARSRLNLTADAEVTPTTIADEVDADMIVLGGRGRSPARKALFGSTTQEVLLGSPCPVTFVRAASSLARPARGLTPPRRAPLRPEPSR
jgi:nucleotide-binding universal stress UspA family protein